MWNIAVPPRLEQVKILAIVKSSYWESFFFFTMKICVGETEECCLFVSIQTLLPNPKEAATLSVLTCHLSFNYFPDTLTLIFRAFSVDIFTVFV